MTLTRAQKEVLRLLQVADKFLRAAGDNPSSKVGASCKTSIKLMSDPCCLVGSTGLFTCELLSLHFKAKAQSGHSL